MTTAQYLVNVYDGLEAWSNEGDFSKNTWEAYKKAAVMVQRSKNEMIEQSISDFLSMVVPREFKGLDDESKLFILFRLVFDLPENAPVSERRSFKGWTNWPKANSDGEVNIAWPVRWNNGEPFIEAKYEGSEGRPYNALAEFRHFRNKYNFRQIYL